MNWLRILLPCLLLPLVLPAQEEADRAGDERLLKEHGVGHDAAALLKFLRLRSPTGDDRAEIGRLLAALGSDSFEEREAATQDLIQRGKSVVDDLKKRTDDPDAEVRRRAAQALAEIEHGPGPALPIAAVRLLARQPPTEVVPALMRYLPFADDESVEDEVALALERLHKDRALQTALLGGLRDPSATVRGVAGQVVGKVGSAEQKAQATALLKDAAAAVRFRTALGLLAGGQRDATLAVIDLLTEETPMCWQAEEVLYRLAGEKGPTETTTLTGPDGRKKSRDVWAAWWDKNGAGIDLARLGEARQMGLTLGIEYNSGRVWEAGPDRSFRFELKGLQGPMEAQILPGGRVLIAESNARMVTERDLRGNVLWTVKLEGHEPTGCQRLANGNTFVSTYSRVMEYTREGKAIYEFALPQGSNAIRKHRNGNIIFATDEHVVEIDTTGREVRRIAIPKESMYVGLRDLPGDRFLLANSSSGRVIEIDRTGKIVWEGRVAGACGIDRTATGHTLVATSGRVVELDRAGNVVWELKTGSGYVRRVHRR